jgi:hypothetical protein
MSAPRLAVAFLIIAVTVAGGVAALDTTLDGATTGQTVVNETFDPGSGGRVTLDDSNRDDVLYNRTVTVFDSSGTSTTVAEAPDDYRWDDSNGTLIVDSSGSLAGDASANVTYGYRVAGEQTIGVQRITALLPQLFGLVLPLGLVLVFISLLN